MTTAPIVLDKSRQAKMLEELVHALRQIPRENLMSWGKDSAELFGRITWRRARNFGKLFAKGGHVLVSEVKDGLKAHKKRNLKDHVADRANVARSAISSVSSSVASSAKEIQEAIRANPGKNAPTLVVSTLAFLVASGGADGDGGVPDLDLAAAGIDAHRSIFTHSIIAGATIEAMLLASASFIGIAHSYLPEDHDPIWDSVAKHKDEFVLAASKGATLGIAYHLFIDSTVDIGTYQDLPVSLPIEGHQALAGANAVAEGVDVKHKSEKPPTGEPAASPLAAT